MSEHWSDRILDATPVQSNELEVIKRALERTGEVTHKKNPTWATTDRLIISAANTRICFEFSGDGSLWNISWGPYQDMV